MFQTQWAPHFLSLGSQKLPQNPIIEPTSLPSFPTWQRLLFAVNGGAFCNWKVYRWSGARGTVEFPGYHFQKLQVRPHYDSITSHNPLLLPPLPTHAGSTPSLRSHFHGWELLPHIFLLSMARHVSCLATQPTMCLLPQSLGRPWGGQLAPWISFIHLVPRLGRVSRCFLQRCDLLHNSYPVIYILILNLAKVWHAEPISTVCCLNILNLCNFLSLWLSIIRNGVWRALTTKISQFMSVIASVFV